MPLLSTSLRKHAHHVDTRLDTRMSMGHSAEAWKQIDEFR